MSQHIGLSNKTDQWFTPPEIIDRVRAVLGAIDLDPCGSEQSNLIVGASRVITENSIDTSWGMTANIFCNPPSGKYTGEDVMYKGLTNPQAFFKKINTRYFLGKTGQYIYLGYSIEQLQTLQTKTCFPEGCFICIPSKRTRFVDQSGSRNSPTHANCIIYRGPYAHRFYQEFRDLGMILTQ